MKQAQKKRASTKPKHKHTKEYLKHYYPFIPLFISIGFLITAIFMPLPKTDDSLAQDTKETVAYTEMQNELMAETNTVRTKQGLSVLTPNEELTKAATSKAEDMVARDYWSHNTPDGRDPWSFLTNAGYSYQKAGENLAYGFKNDKDILEAWLNSSTHRANVLNPEFAEFGLGTATSNNFNGKGPAKVVVALYADPATSPLPESHYSILGAEKQISYIESLTGIQWLTSAVTLLIAAIVLYLLATHTLAVKSVLSKTEKFVTRHPIIDSTLILLLAVGVYFIRTHGAIL